MFFNSSPLLMAYISKADKTICQECLSYMMTLYVKQYA
jgi:hypothetical protein